MDGKPRIIDLYTLPEDVHEAIESLRLAIMRHRLNGWQDCNVNALGCVLADLAMDVARDTTEK